jgi:aspartate aminotransferase
MFSHLNAMPDDPILGLLVKYKQDENPKKIDLGIGVCKNELGHTEILNCVKKAEKYRLDTEDTKAYIGRTGSTQFNDEMSKLTFDAHKVLIEDRVRTISTLGGTGALRVAAEFINSCVPNATMWVSDPTWENH